METTARTKVNPAMWAGNHSPDIQLTGEQKAGMNLAYCLLLLIACMAMGMLLFFCLQDANAPGPVYESLLTLHDSDSLYAAKLAYVRSLVEDRQEYCMMVTKHTEYMLGILLPVLTSVLGYIFGTRAKG